MMEVSTNALIENPSNVWEEVAAQVCETASLAAFGFDLFKKSMVQLGVTLLRFSEREEVRAEVESINQAMTRGRRWTPEGYTAHKIHEVLASRGMRVLSKKHLLDCVNAAARAKENGLLEENSGQETTMRMCGRALLGWSQNRALPEPSGVNIQRVISPAPTSEQHVEKTLSANEYSAEFLAVLASTTNKLNALLERKPRGASFPSCLSPEQLDNLQQIRVTANAVLEHFNLRIIEPERTNAKR